MFFLQLLGYHHCSPFDSGFRFKTMELTQGRALKTDLCILTGSNTLTPYAEYWTDYSNEPNGIVMTENNTLKHYSASLKTPSLRVYHKPFSCDVEKSKITKTKINGQPVKCIQIGAYPQSVTDKKTAQALEKAFLDNTLTKTQNKYTLNTNLNPNEDVVLTAHEEYEFQGNYYIRFINQNKTNCLLSTGQKPQLHQPYWIRVEAVDWLCEPDINYKEETAYFISRHTLLSGISCQKIKMILDIFSEEIHQHPVQTEKVPTNRAIFKAEQDYLKKAEYHVLHFKEFIRNTLINEIENLTRLTYFQTITQLAEKYTNTKKNNPQNSSEQNQIFQFTHNYIVTCMKEENKTPYDLLLALHLEIAKQKFQEKDIHLSTKQRLLTGQILPFTNIARQKED